MTTTEEDKANIKNDDTNTNTTNVADNDNDNDNDDDEHQHQTEQQEQQLLLFASLLIKRIVKLLNYKPYDFAITLLPPPPPPPPPSQSQSSPLVVSCDETINDDEEDDNNNSLLLLLTPEYRNLLETSIMLIREEEEDVVNENDNDNDDTPKATATTTTATKAKYHLGLEAQNLPFIAKTIRKVYHTTKMKMKKSKANAKKLQEDITNNSNNKNRDKKEVVEEETKTTTLNLLLFNITSCLLLIQPDHSTVWSDRRRCLLFIIQRMKTETQQQNNPEQEEKKENELLVMMWYNELDYLDLLLTQHSKAPSSWAHRKYVLRQLLSLHNKHHQQVGGNNYMRSLGNMTSIQDLVMKEVNGICSSVAEKYPKNYYAWTHRIYVVSELLLPTTMFIKNNTINNSISNASKFLETELKEKMYNEWLPKHPTDHSAIHYTCQMLDYLFDILKKNEEYYLLYLMETYDDGDYEELHYHQQLKTLHAEVVMKKYELSILALKQIQILLSKYYQSSNSNPNSNCDCNCNESLWILRRMTCQIIWKHSSSSSSYIVIKHHENENENESLRMMMMMRRLVRNDIKSVIDSLNIIPTRISSSISDKEEEDSSLSSPLSQLVDASNAYGGDEKMDAISNTNNIHAWTFLAWCIVNITNIDVDDNNDNSNGNSNDNEKTKRSSSSSFSLSSFSSTTTSTTTTLFTHDIRETVMRRLQGAEATATPTTATAANNDGSTADATTTAATTTTTTAQHNNRLWTSSSSPNILLV